MKTISLIGNFDVPWCSEAHYAWTLEEKLGWKVIRLQENRTSADEVIRACDKSDALFWVHTHTWGISNEMRILEHVKSKPLPSFSYHLDKYFGLPARTGSYFAHPSFHLDKFFSTDGGHDLEWPKYGITHHWVLPGCVEYGVYLADPDPAQHIDVLFSGSVGYHGEYKFRKEMVEALQFNYGPRFKVINGVREAALNTAYASATVCVGDHIFSGQPRYCSDRLMESAGRGAFIIYPRTKDITEEWEKHGLVVYDPQNISDLISKIDYYLDKSNEVKRLLKRDATFAFAKNNHTYTHRLKQILAIMGLS